MVYNFLSLSVSAKLLQDTFFLLNIKLFKCVKKYFKKLQNLGATPYLLFIFIFEEEKPIVVYKVIKIASSV